jgi:hypothetical protein
MPLEQIERVPVRPAAQAAPSRTASRWYSRVWLAWVPILALATARLFKWHIDYFHSPGPQFHKAAMIFLPALVISAWAYAALRRKWLWQYELAGLAILTAAPLLFYEPRATAVSVLFFMNCCATGGFAVRKLGLDIDHPLGGPLDRIAVGFGAGCGLLITALLGLGLAHLLYPGVLWGLLLAPVAVFWRGIQQAILDLYALHLRWRNSPALRHPVTGVAIVFGLVALVCALMSVLAPAIAFDALDVHLPSVQYYASQHALAAVPGIDYSYYPQGMELIWTLAYSLAGQAGAQVISALFFLVFLMIFFRLERECGIDPGTAAAGVVCAATLPFLHWTGSVLKNDLAMAFFQALGLYCFVRFRAARDFRWICVGAFFLAQSFGVKDVAMFGALPLALLYLYAVLGQPRRWKAAFAIIAVFAVFGAYWPLRTYVLTGNPLALHVLGRAQRGLLAARRTTSTRQQVSYYAGLPWRLTFAGHNAFESPLESPIGILLFAFFPLALLTGRRPKTAAQLACVLFTALYFPLWARTLYKVRYAILPFAFLAALATVWIRKFYDVPAGKAGRAVRLSLLGVETYCLLVAVIGVMIIEVNGPQLAYFTGRLDRPGYLRSALRTYPALEFLRQTAGPSAPVFGVENFSRAYAPDPLKFQSMPCRPQWCAASEVVSKVEKSGARYLILPESAVGEEVLHSLGSGGRVPLERKDAELIYHDPYFAVYDLGAGRAQGAADALRWK